MVKVEALSGPGSRGSVGRLYEQDFARIRPVELNNEIVQTHFVRLQAAGPADRNGHEDDEKDA